MFLFLFPGAFVFGEQEVILAGMLQFIRNDFCKHIDVLYEYFSYSTTFYHGYAI